MKLKVQNILGVLIVLILSGCTTVVHPVSQTEHEPFEVHASVQNRRSSIKFLAEDDAEETCLNLMKSAGSNLDRVPMACAEFRRHPQPKCQIYVNKSTSYTVIGHEVRHCFEGHFH